MLTKVYMSSPRQNVMAPAKYDPRHYRSSRQSGLLPPRDTVQLQLCCVRGKQQAVQGGISTVSTRLCFQPTIQGQDK
jgi:hypothetical protein